MNASKKITAVQGRPLEDWNRACSLSRQRRHACHGHMAPLVEAPARVPCVYRLTKASPASASRAPSRTTLQNLLTLALAKPCAEVVMMPASKPISEVIATHQTNVCIDQNECDRLLALINDKIIIPTEYSANGLGGAERAGKDIKGRAFLYSHEILQSSEACKQLPVLVQILQALALRRSRTQPMSWCASCHLRNTSSRRLCWQVAESFKVSNSNVCLVITWYLGGHFDIRVHQSLGGGKARAPASHDETARSHTLGADLG